MADNSIDLVVSKQAFDQLDRLLAEIKAADAAITALNTNAGKNAATPSGAENNSAENAKLIAQMKEYNAEIARQAAQIQKLESAKKSYNREVTQESVNATIRNQKAREAFKATSDEIDNYQRLDAAYKKAVKSAQDLGAQYGANSKQFLTAANAAKELDDKLKAIDGAVGKYGRNVGNYASGWNGLANSVNQLTREAPAFANSLNTGFMALSNNIPILYDEIDNLRKKNEELAASGKPTESVTKSLIGAFFSWQTALSVGVTLLTIYGGKLIEYVFNTDAAKKSTDNLTKSLKDNEDQVKENIKQIQYQGELEIQLAKLRGVSEEELAKLRIKTGVSVVSEYEKQYNKINAQLDSFDAYQRLKNEDKGKALLFLERKYNGDLVKARAEYQRREAAYNEENRKLLVEAKKKAYAELKDANDKNVLDDLSSQVTLNDDKKASDKKAEEDRLKLLEEANVRRYEANLSNLNRQKEIAKDELESFRGGIAERIQLSINLQLAEIKIAEAIAAEKRRIAKGDKNLLVVAENERLTELENTKTEHISRVAKFYKDIFDKADDMFPKTIFGDKYKMSDEDKKNLEDYKREVERSLNEIRDFIQSFGNDFASSTGFRSTFDFFIRVDKEGKTMFDKLNTEGLTAKEKFGATFNAIAESAQEAFNFISNASQQNFDAEYARLEAQKDIAMQFAGESDSARKKVEEDAEKRRKEIATREFKAKKEQAIVNIAMDTAQALIGLWVKPGFPAAIPMSIVVASLGAIQAGVVASQKVPQYFEGTDNHPGGLALINDGKGANYKETVVTPDGKVRQFSGRDVMIDAPAGTQVFTHDQWNNELNTMMREKGISMSNSFQSKSGLTYQEMDSIIAKHFSKITTQSTVIDKNGFNTFVSSGTSKTIRNQYRYSGTGFAV
jgi:hypothetical protein